MVDYSNIPRDSRRVPLATKVQFKFGSFSGFISEYSANISPTGMYIVSSQPEPAGQELDFEFRLGDGFEIIKGKGEVVWSRAVAEGVNRPPGMGIRFTELSDGSKDLIYRIVDRYVQEGGTPFDLTSSRERAAGLLEPEPAAPAPFTLPETAPAASDLPPIELEADPFPDLDFEPVKDSSGNALPWFSAGSAEPPPAAQAPAPPPPAPPVHEDELELFPSIGPALEEVEQTFAGRAPAPLRFPAAAPAPSLRIEEDDEVEVEPIHLAPVTPLAPVSPAPPPVAAVPPPAAPPPLDVFAPFDGPGLGALDPLEPLGSGEPEPPRPEPVEPPGLFADYLPKPSARPAAPAARPVAALAGSAAAQEPRRMLPFVLLGLLAVLGAGAFLLREQVPVWLGLGGGDETASAAAPRPGPRTRPQGAPMPPPVVQEGGLTSEAAAATTDMTTASGAGSSTGSNSGAEPPPTALPEAVQRKPAPAPAPVAPAPAPAPPAATPATAGIVVSALDRITYEETLGGTDIVLWGDGAFRPESFVRSQMSSPPRALVRLLGMRRPFSQTRIAVGTGEVKQVRIGYHESPRGNEVHVVIDLAGAGVKITRVDQDGQRLRIHLQKG